MLKSIIALILIGLFFAFTPVAFYLSSYSSTTSLENQKVKYNLPYPGILPDHPLFFIKSFRDKLIIYITRDNIKKAELRLLFSDKKASMALSLAQKGKEKPAIKAIKQAEEDFRRLIKNLNNAKKQGISADGSFVVKIKLANEKHREVIETLLKELPQGQSDDINEILNINEEIKKSLEKL